jgi:radical SAM superfamily enzyme YgiQ (UPF0313 family)
MMTMQEIQVSNEQFNIIIDKLVYLDQNIPGQGISLFQAEKIKSMYVGGPIFGQMLHVHDIYNEKRIFRNALNIFFEIKMSSIINDMILSFQQIKQPLKIVFISFGSKWHQDIWNILSIETLVGDLYGEYSNQIECYYTRINTYDDIKETICFLDCHSIDIIGFSIEIRTNEIFDQFYNEYISKRKELPLMVYGNKVPTYTIGYFSKKYLSNDGKSMIILDNGEIPFRDIVKYTCGEISIDNIKNAVWIDNSGNIQKNEVYADNNLLVYPPLMLTVRLNQVNILEASRGCFFQCSYCAQNGKLWSSLPFDRIIENIERLFSHGVSDLEFVDNDFFGGRNKRYIDRAKYIATSIEKLSQKYSITPSYRVFTNPLVLVRCTGNERETETNQSMRELVLYMKNTGLTRVYVGVETASINQRKRYNRKDTIEECKASINMLRELGIDIDVGFIMFDPQMDLNDMKENINFYKEMDLIKVNTYPFCDIRLTFNTPMATSMECEKLIIGECKEELCYQYKFKDDNVNLIYQAVHSLVKKTGHLFQIIKYITKERYSNNLKTDVDFFSRKVVEENALIYLDMMEEIIYKYEIGSNDFAEQIKHAQIRIIQLLEHIILNLHLFDMKKEYYIKLKKGLREACQNLEHELVTNFNNKINL